MFGRWFFWRFHQLVILIYPYRVEKFNRPLDEFEFWQTDGAKLRVDGVACYIR